MSYFFVVINIKLFPKYRSTIKSSTKNGHVIILAVIKINYSLNISIHHHHLLFLLVLHNFFHLCLIQHLLTKHQHHFHPNQQWIYLLLLMIILNMHQNMNKLCWRHCELWRSGHQKMSQPRKPLLLCAQSMGNTAQIHKNNPNDHDK